VPIVKTYVDERGEPVARIVEEDGIRVISMDVFREVAQVPEGAEVVEITERYRVLAKRRPLLNGICEFVYFQFRGGIQLINVKYVGPDDAEAAIPALLKVVEEEVGPGEENRQN
jgi:hypothetical protein